MSNNSTNVIQFPVSGEKLSANQRVTISLIVATVGARCHYSQSIKWHCWKKLRSQFNVKTAADIPASQYEAVVATLKKVDAQVTVLRNLLDKAEQRFCKDVLLMDGDLDQIEQELKEG